MFYFFMVIIILNSR
ncbi:hypothetical protein PFBG_00648 [Plasmodium falciparum 7G8]|uniref:Uncharacterized protein n=1 Tax=Plasmodium falciparum (isolate 7G8) TaxID=57266 RepID=W7FLE4_PLAF8|nr:hypothetical protein PFBG_00648 [Plasmodium falciparum 7G8]